MLGGYALLLAGVACFYFGSQHFYGLRSTWLAVGLAVLAGIAIFLVAHPGYRIRVALLWRKGQGFAPRFTMSVLAYPPQAPGMPSSSSHSTVCASSAARISCAPANSS